MKIVTVINAFNNDIFDVIKGEVTDKKIAALALRATKSLQAKGYLGSFTAAPKFKGTGEGAKTTGRLKLVSSDPDDLKRAKGELPLEVARWSFDIPGVKLRTHSTYTNKGAARSAAEAIAQLVECDRVVLTDGTQSVAYDVKPLEVSRQGYQVHLVAVKD